MFFTSKCPLRVNVRVILDEQDESLVLNLIFFLFYDLKSFKIFDFNLNIKSHGIATFDVNILKNK